MTKIEAMLKYVSEYNEFYISRGMTGNLVLDNVSIIDRSTIQKARKNILSKQYMGLNFGQLVTFVTSGSNGQPLRVYWDLKDYYKSMSCLIC